MIIHLQTVTQTTFAAISEDGEIGETRTVTSIVRKLSEAEFAQLLENLRNAKEEIRTELEPRSE